jgi:hypothetical protein
MMTRKLTKTEEANIKLNKVFNGENQDEPELEPLINNNNYALVLKNNENDDEDIKDS